MSDQQRLKLLVISMMYEPDCVGIAAIASDMCAGLAERGHDVTVYTTYPYYPEWKLKTKASFWRVGQETIEGVRVRRHRIFVPSNPSRLIPRLVHELSFPISLARNLFRRDKYDVVMVYCPLMGGVVFAGLRKLLRGDRLWVNIQDNPADAAAASGIIRSGLISRFAAKVQKAVLNRADVWSSISPDMIGRLELIRSEDMPILLCPNWLTRTLSDPIGRLESKVGRPTGQPMKLLYCGTIGKKQGLLEFCEGLCKSDLDFRFQIRGAGGEADSVRRWVESRGDHRFQFGALVPHQEFIESIHAADWFVVPQRSSAGGAFFPSKLIPSMSVGTPILAVTEQDGPLFREVSENGLGLIVPWSKVDRLGDELDAIVGASGRYTEMQSNCIRRAAMYQRDTAIGHLEQSLLEQASGGVTRSCETRFQGQSDNRVPTA